MSNEKVTQQVLAITPSRDSAHAHDGYLDEKKPEDIHVEDVNAPDADFIPKSPFDDMGIIKTLKVFKWAVLLSALAAFSAAADGYQIAMTGNIIANQGFIKVYGTQYNAKGQLILAADILAAWGGIQSAGQGIAMLSMSFIADRFGRKKAMFGLWLSLVIAVFCETFGRHWQVWLVAKFFSGFGVGSVQFITGTYISEIAPPRIRGLALLHYSVFYGIGQLMATTALRVMRLQNPNLWLPLIYSEWATIVIMFMIYLYIPESPWWCANNGHHERGRAELKRVNGGIEGYDVDYHYSILQRTVEREMSKHGIEAGRQITIWENIKNTREIFIGTNGFRTLIAFMPAAVQQLTGLAVIGQYSSYFAQQTGFADPFLFTVLLSLVAIVITIIGAFVTDIIGRRVLFLASTLTTWSMLLIIGGLGLSKRNESLDKLLVFFSMCWRMASTILGDLGWSYVAETGTSRLRARTAGFSAAGGVCFGLVFSTSVPYMLNVNAANWGLRTMFFFAGISAPLCIGSVFIMPDISKRTPAELDEMFEKKIRPWRFRSYVSEAQKALQEERERTGVTDPTAEARP